MYVFRASFRNAHSRDYFYIRADIIPKRRYRRNGFIKQILTADYTVNDASPFEKRALN